MQRNFVSALAFLAMVWSCVPASAEQVQRMKLLTAQTGWVQVGQRLDWTTMAAHIGLTSLRLRPPKRAYRLYSSWTSRQAGCFS